MKRWLMSMFCLVLLFVCSGGLRNIYVARAAVIDLGSFKPTVVQTTIFNGKTSRIPFRVDDIPKDNDGYPYQISGSAPWTMKEGFVCLERDGEETILTDCGLIPITQSDKDESDNYVNLYIEGKNFIEGYKRTEGDVWTIGGTWENAEYRLTIEPFVFVVGGSGGYSDSECIQEYVTEAEQMDFCMLEGASLRFNFEQGKNGIRFRAEIGENVDPDATYYMMIVPKAYIDKYQITENYYLALKEALQKEGRSDFIASMVCLPVQFSDAEIQEGNGALKNGYWYVQGALTNIKYENVKTSFFAIAYYIDANGEYHYADFKIGTNHKNLYEIANSAIQSGKYAEQEEELAILREYVAMGNALDIGMSKEEYEASK